MRVYPYLGPYPRGWHTQCQRAHVELPRRSTRLFGIVPLLRWLDDVEISVGEMVEALLSTADPQVADDFKLRVHM